MQSTRFFRILVLALLISHGAYPVFASPARTAATQQRIEKTLVKLAGPKGLMPRVIIVESPFPQAFAKEDNTVVISTVLADLTGNRHELAFILAHEMGHIALHFGLSPRKFVSDHQKNKVGFSAELEADQYALDLLKDRGFSTRQGVKILKKLGSYGEDKGFSMGLAFPSLLSRIKFMETLPHPRLQSSAKGLSKNRKQPIATNRQEGQQIMAGPKGESVFNG